MLGKKIALGFGIAILFPMMVHYGFATFSPPPKQSIFTPYESTTINEDGTRTTKHLTPLERTQRMKEYQNIRKQYSKKQFYVVVPMGILAIIIGILIPLQSIGTGLIFGGIFSIIEGYFGYWFYLSNELKFISLLIAFVILIFAGFKKFK